MNILRKLDENGQTMIEYILIMVVVITVAQSVFKKLDAYMIDHFQKKYLGSYANMFGGSSGSFEGKYQQFHIRR